jgi:uncharacterized protein
MRDTPGMSARAAALASLVSLCACGGTSPTSQAPPTLATGTFPSGSVQLSYALDVPSGSGPFPAFVLGHGSGRTTKSEAIDLARDLTREGYAVLRYDKRGVGSSTGVYEGVGTANSERMIGTLADDMAAGVRFLRTLPEIDPRRIGLIGASQAGWIIPEAATRIPVHSMVLLSGPTVSVGEEIFYSDLAEGTPASFEELSTRLAGYTGPRGYDPRRALESLTTPGLWLLGGQDRSIPTRETVAILRALSAAGKPYRWVVYEQAGHGLIDPRGGMGTRLADILSFLGTVR